MAFENNNCEKMQSDVGVGGGRLGETPGCALLAEDYTD